MRENMQEQDAWPGGPKGTRCFDVFSRCKRRGLRINDPGNLHPVHQRDHHGDDPQGGCENGRQADRQQECRKCHHEVGETHDGGTHPALNVARDNSEQRSQGHSTTVGNYADNQRRACSIQQARKKVSTQKVCAKQESLVRRKRRTVQGQTIEKLLGRIKGSDDRSSHRGCHHARDDHHAEQCEWVPPQTLPSIGQATPLPFARLREECRVYAERPAPGLPNACVEKPIRRACDNHLGPVCQMFPMLRYTRPEPRAPVWCLVQVSHRQMGLTATARPSRRDTHNAWECRSAIRTEPHLPPCEPNAS